MRVGGEGKEKASGKERGGKGRRRRRTERHYHTKHCLLFKVTTAGAVKAGEILKTERGRL